MTGIGRVGGAVVVVGGWDDDEMTQISLSKTVSALQKIQLTCTRERHDTGGNKTKTRAKKISRISVYI